MPPNLHSLLRQAAQQHFHDLHFEANGNKLSVHGRGSSGLQTIAAFDGADADRLIAALAHQADLQLRADHPSDGRLSIDSPSGTLAFRASAIVTIDGVSIVLRRLSAPPNSTTLQALGMPRALRERMALRLRSSGCCLISGPTGAGKTTTLYAALNQLANANLKILTIEDPVEYQMAFACQSQVNPAADWDFPNALRHFLRQDPDLIVVGEIRDAATAALACEAGLTGHTVLSTLHAGSPLNALLRLREWHLPPSLIADAVCLSINQRLLPALCPHCRSDLASNASPAHPSLHFHHAASQGRCPECHFTGTIGHIALFAFLECTPQATLAALANAHPTTTDFPASLSLANALSAAIDARHISPQHALAALLD